MEEDLSDVSEPLTSGAGPELGQKLEPLKFDFSTTGNAAVIVAHPDDETLWAGGMILTHSAFNWVIVTLCRKNDPDRSPKFYDVVRDYGAKGFMADLDDGPEQAPLDLQEVQHALLQILPPVKYDLVLTHAPNGEYTRHRRHEEVSRAVIDLWLAGVISAKELWLFAYNDDGGSHLPTAIETAHHFATLPEAIFKEKYRLVTEIYGFRPDSWEARVTPRSEAFWRFVSPSELKSWLESSGK